MAGYRQFYTKFWKDEWLIDLEPLERYLFSYLFTNDLSSISGIYKIPLKVIRNETGLSEEDIKKYLNKFQDEKKIFYQDGVMWVVNMQKHHKNASPTTMTKVIKDVQEIPDCPVKKAYLYYQKTGIYLIDTVSIHNSEREREIERESLNKAEAEDKINPTPTSPSDWQPYPPPMQFQDPDLLILDRIFIDVTSFLPPKEVDRVRDTIRMVAKREGLEISPGNEQKIASVLRPYYLELCKRKNKAGQHYAKTSLFWLFEWAATGEIPKLIKEETSLPEVDPEEKRRFQEELRKAREKQ